MLRSVIAKPRYCTCVSRGSNGGCRPLLTCIVRHRALAEAQSEKDKEQKHVASLMSKRKHVAHQLDSLQAKAEALTAEVRVVSSERDAVVESLESAQTRLQQAEQDLEAAHEATTELRIRNRDHHALAQDVQRLTQERNSARRAAEDAQRRADAFEKQLTQVSCRVESVEEVRAKLRVLWVLHTT